MRHTWLVLSDHRARALRLSAAGSTRRRRPRGEGLPTAQRGPAEHFFLQMPRPGLNFAAKALRVSLLAIVVLILVVAASARARAMCAQSARSLGARCKVAAAVVGWYVVSMSIIFTNKHLSLTTCPLEYFK